MIYIINKFDVRIAGKEQDKNFLYKRHNRISVFRKSIKYNLIRSGKKAHPATATEIQFPTKLAFANNEHKIQDQTIKEGFQVVVN